MYCYNLEKYSFNCVKRSATEAKRSKLKQSRTWKAELTLSSARNGRFTTIDLKEKARFDDEVSNSETVRFQMPTHSGRFAVTDVNGFKYYCVYLWEELSKILSRHKVSLVLAYVPCLHKFHPQVNGVQLLSALRIYDTFLTNSNFYSVMFYQLIFLYLSILSSALE